MGYQPSNYRPTEKPLNVMVLLVLIAFGLYLLFGAYFLWRYTKWPIFLPPQLDLFGLLFSLFGEKIGAYIGAIFLTVLGLICVLAPIFLINKLIRKSPINSDIK